jgi:hypothetical protein
MNSDREIIEYLVAGGLLGAALGALVSDDNRDAAIGALAGAALVASFRANQRAQATGIPLVIEQDNELIRVYPDGRRELIRKIPRTNAHIPKKFKLR